MQLEHQTIVNAPPEVLFRMVFEHVLNPLEAGTEVVHRVTFSGLLSLVLGPILRKQLNVGLPITLGNLKRLAERHHAASAGE